MTLPVPSGGATLSGSPSRSISGSLREGSSHARVGSMPAEVASTILGSSRPGGPPVVVTLTEQTQDGRIAEGAASISITFSPSARGGGVDLPTPSSTGGHSGSDKHVSFVSGSPPSDAISIPRPSPDQQRSRDFQAGAPLVSPASSARSVTLIDDGFSGPQQPALLPLRRPRSVVSEAGSGQSPKFGPSSGNNAADSRRTGSTSAKRSSTNDSASLSSQSERDDEDAEESLLDDDYSDFLLTLQESRDRRPTLPLTPFSDQVGGHTPFLRFSDKAVCKPLDDVERDFYENADPELIEFMAGYLGVVDVTYGAYAGSSGAGAPTKLAQEDWWERTPVALLDTSNGLLDDGDEESRGALARSAPSPHYNAALRKQVFREALSPRSLKARFAQLKSTMSHLARPSSSSKHSSGPVKHQPLTDGEDDDAKKLSKSLGNLDIYRRASGASLLVEPAPNSPSSVSSGDKFSFMGYNSVPPDERLSPVISPVLAPLSADGAQHMHGGAPSNPSSPGLNPIFHMSDDEGEDQDGTKGPRKQLTLPPPKTSTNGAEDLSSRGYLSLPAHTYAHTGVNPWSLQMMEKLNSKMADSKTQQFLLLQDLTGGMKHPCILDLKMGTRQHGIFATREKKESQERKCERTTSKHLGVRVCGMQVFKLPTSTYYYTDKYYGRRVQVDDFKESLLSFLDNGSHLLLGYIPTILDKLRRLKAAVERLSSYRFYASSLLILYDADWAADELNSRGDKGDDSDTDDGPSSEGGWESDLSEDAERDAPKSRREKALQPPAPRKEVLIKMIDFSHSITNRHLLVPPDAPADAETVFDPVTGAHVKGIRCNYPPTTKGPDNGYLRGLDNLIKAFEDCMNSFKVEAHLSLDEARKIGGIMPLNSPLSTDSEAIRMDD